MNDKKNISAIRMLSVQQIEKAKSGHPGLPLGAAPILYELYKNHLNYDPSLSIKDYFNQDRFVLSAGHGSALLYSVLHLFGYDLSISDLKEFRQFGSKTPGHPEYGVTDGVQASTGPLGAGLGMAVGMAMAAKHQGIECANVYTLVGDGCLQEGISYEAMSFAGTNKLNNLIVLYDSNRITIEGSTDIAFTEDVLGRAKAFGFETFEVMDGNDCEEIGNAITKAKDSDKPSFIKVNTHIGFGAGKKQDSASAHGEPLGEEAMKELRKNLDWDEPDFEIPEDVKNNFEEIKSAVIERSRTPVPMKSISDFDAAFVGIGMPEKAGATRAYSGEILNALSKKIPELFGGSADLGPSNKTTIKEGGDFSPENYSGKNVHFGIREIFMASAMNGIALFGGLIPYGATFFSFADYMKPMLRLASLMKIRTISILTHDSIGVGEDGPTHEPIEQLTMLRAMPNINVWRPASFEETKAAYYSALAAEETPSVLVLSRQTIPFYEEQNSKGDILKGGYVAYDCKGFPEGIIIASGSEVPLAISAAKELENIRVVSIPCLDIFEKQSIEYKESILPSYITKRLAVEAGSSLSFKHLVGLFGKVLGLDHFGESAPAPTLFGEFGFTKDNVINEYREM